ncbi:MAG: hypothetical protein A3E07_01760 [Candidatus Wildermuthbacteria bacterium RIFCSPHIGHO2_12_FULL_45_9]|uniref:Uncharacterized protein n=1 Tax=Candidatus Wildermuthbacteria bacterium RIFCSPHIGHO2_02_FULL_45_25 TaxID=1802450 RepID=A0A1G2R3J6_9BACT|nr:MAG: hypothetical protein A2748_03275 [Candidatus Wildermuthbacteria bacterium RIFCSPHIGHO2_01_FULL_45_20]OHA67420.1 MAG: hypothetical protein A3C04_03495 [Candidatus Wildermuthbacteria bacterium RIFCSPHIGHO2_02_FULL_45_25]OHA71494.1 MAG: hypothetical protein A3E07_01760 [Candidatus Wildermuthbacteria bacterium RIFCSPHIGHO2_12_FULL_45_9]
MTNRNLKLFLIAILLVIVCAAGGVGFYYWEKQLPARVPAPQVSPAQTTPSPINSAVANGQSEHANPYNVESFYLLFSGKLTRHQDGYTFEETLTPAFFEDAPIAMKSAIDKFLTAQSLYKLEIVYDNGQRSTFYTSVFRSVDDISYPLKDEELAVGESGYTDIIIAKISPNVSAIRFSVGKTIVKSLTRPASGPKIILFRKRPSNSIVNEITQNGFTIEWKTESDNRNNLGYVLERKLSPAKWEAYSFGEGASGSVFQNLDDIHTSMEKVDYRLIVTDGFYANVWHEKEFIELPQERNLELFLNSYQNPYWILGQGTTLELDFTDPETGDNCNALGCKNGNYFVTWTSDKQTICQADIAQNGRMEYQFKKPGLHTIKVVAKHKIKSGIRGEKILQFFVKEPDISTWDSSQFENKNPNCSAH